MFHFVLSLEVVTKFGEDRYSLPLHMKLILWNITFDIKRPPRDLMPISADR